MADGSSTRAVELRHVYPWFNSRLIDKGTTKACPTRDTLCMVERTRRTWWFSPSPRKPPSPSTFLKPQHSRESRPSSSRRTAFDRLSAQKKREEPYSQPSPSKSVLPHVSPLHLELSPVPAERKQYWRNELEKANQTDVSRLLQRKARLARALRDLP